MIAVSVRFGVDGVLWVVVNAVGKTLDAGLAFDVRVLCWRFLGLATRG